jgi:ornithine cyclodeaminase/alanine dehydrogenase-like protein (mu-crystallin family)
MSDRCRVEIIPVPRPQQAAERKDIVITATDSREPVLAPQWLEPGVHINAVGSNFIGKAELEPGVLRRCTSVVVDSKEQARLEAGDFQQPLEDGTLRWDNVRELGQVIVGRHAGRRHPQDVTLFKSLGIAIEDVAVAARVYQKAQAEGVGVWIDW